MRACLLVTLLVAATSANAGQLLVDVDRSVDGSVFTLSILAEEGESFRGFDFSYEGELNQQLAAGMSTPFTNFDAFLPDGGAKDSKFLFASGDVLSIGVEESDTGLRGAISGLASGNFPNPTPFVRLVAPGFCLPGSFTLAVDLGGSVAQFTGSDACPEPSSCLLAGLALVGLTTRRVGRAACL